MLKPTWSIEVALVDLVYVVSRLSPRTPYAALIRTKRSC